MRRSFHFQYIIIDDQNASTVAVKENRVQNGQTSLFFFLFFLTDLHYHLFCIWITNCWSCGINGVFFTLSYEILFEKQTRSTRASILGELDAFDLASLVALLHLGAVRPLTGLLRLLLWAISHSGLPNCGVRGVVETIHS